MVEIVDKTVPRKENKNKTKIVKYTMKGSQKSQGYAKVGRSFCFNCGEFWLTGSDVRHTCRPGAYEIPTCSERVAISRQLVDWLI